jgi:hypothetical protein
MRERSSCEHAMLVAGTPKARTTVRSLLIEAFFGMKVK